MKIRSLSSLLCLILASNVFANDENDKYFIAYNASQTSRLPDVLKKQMQSDVILDQIAVEALKKIGETQLAEEYYHRPDLQNKLRPLVQNFIVSKSGSELFDEASTQLFSTIYSVEELKALYQNNKSVEGQKFINASMGVDLSTQDYINHLYKQKFDQTSLDQLEENLDKIYTKYNFNSVSVTPKTYSSSEQDDSEPKKAISIDPTAQNTMNPRGVSGISQNVEKTDIDQIDQSKAVVEESIK